MSDNDLAQVIAKAIVEATNSKNMNTAQSNGNGAPWWSKSLWMVGPLGAIALLLVAQSAGLLSSPMREEHAKIMDTSETTNYLLRSLCIIQQSESDLKTRSDLCNPPPKSSSLDDSYEDLKAFSMTGDMYNASSFEANFLNNL